VKPKLLLCPGTGYSATTPLYYTLAVNSQYCHGGFDKEYQLLPLLYFKETKDTERYEYYYKYWFRKHTLSNDSGVYKKSGAKRERHPLVDFNNPYTHLDSEYYLKDPITLEKYIQYFQEHYHNIKDTYQSVCDFTTDNGNLPLWFLQSIAPILQEYFEVKVIIINRDPVRRLFSEVNRKFQKKKRKFSSATELFFHILNHPTQDFGLHRIYEDVNYLTYHKEIVSNYSQAFSSVLEISMEKLWEGKENLSDFLEYPIDNLYHNCYYPFKGSKAIHHKYLEDQWMSDIEDLNHEQYELAKTYLC
jgi:hypothetical protein